MHEEASRDDECSPMRVLVEYYVLDALGRLEPTRQARLGETVCRAFGGSDWRAVIRDRLGLPGNSAEQLCLLLRQRQEEAQVQQCEFSVEAFARQVAGELLGDMG